MAFMILYRFRPFNQHTITELLTEKLHFSHPNTWNDPFEMYGMQEIAAFIVCFSFERKNHNPLQNILMWSHYANSHKGICIEYEYNRDYKKSNFARPVKYSNDFLHLGKYRDFDLDDDECNYGIFQKSKHWRYENEFRIAIYDRYDDPMHLYNDYFSKIIPEGINMTYELIDLKIKGIYCGVKFDKTQIETLKIIRGKRNFEIFTGNHLAGILQYYNSIEFTKLVRLKGLEPSHPKY